MASRYEVEVTVSSASNLKNVNWRNGALRPYAVVWVDDGPKCSTRVDPDNGEDPVWDDTLLVPLPPTSSLHDAVLRVDVVHASEGAVIDKPLVGSARLPLRDVLDDAGVGGARVSRTLGLKRPSGRPQGRLEVQVRVREAPRYYDPYIGYGQGAAPPAGYPAPYGAAAPTVGTDDVPAVAAAAQGQKSGSKMGMGTGLAVGAAAGLLGGLALAEGASYLEDKMEDHVAEKVEEDMFGGGDIGDGGGGDGDGDGDGDYCYDDY